VASVTGAVAIEGGSVSVVGFNPSSGASLPPAPPGNVLLSLPPGSSSSLINQALSEGYIGVIESSGNNANITDGSSTLDYIGNANSDITATGTWQIATGTDDNVNLGSGNITLYGASGSSVTGGDGTYTVLSTTGDITITIGSASDPTFIFDNPGDTINGGAGDATIVGATSVDMNLTAQTGAVVIDGVPGNDLITLGSGNATVYGGVGDTITAGSGLTYIDGTHGSMSIAIGSGGGSDLIFSGAGDTITGGAASATIFGAAGDNLSLATQTGPVMINALAGNETITLGSGAATVYGGSGDTITAGSGADYIDGTRGSISIAIGSGGGSDLIFSGL